MTKRQVFTDSEHPWKVTQRHGSWALYPYKMSVTEWKALLVRAKRGNPEAEWGVAERYGDGCKDHSGRIIVRRSRKKAAQWFRRAAEHGLSDAQNTLGVLLGNGDGIRKNVGEALSWLGKAFHAGDTCAARNIAITYREIGELRMAVKWFRKSVDGDDGDALVQLGIHYYWGKGVRKEPKAAVRCFRTATRSRSISEAGRDDAFFLLGVAYLEGRGVRRSISTQRNYSNEQIQTATIALLQGYCPGSFIPSVRVGRQMPNNPDQRPRLACEQNLLGGWRFAVSYAADISWAVVPAQH